MARSSTVRSFHLRIVMGCGSSTASKEAVPDQHLPAKTLPAKNASPNPQAPAPASSTAATPTTTTSTTAAPAAKAAPEAAMNPNPVADEGNIANSSSSPSSSSSATNVDDDEEAKKKVEAINKISRGEHPDVKKRGLHGEAWFRVLHSELQEFTPGS